MANYCLVLLILLWAATGTAKVDRLNTEAYLGEKRLDGYAERFQPLVFHDVHQGRMFFEDELFYARFFERFLLPEAGQFSYFMKSELSGGLTCPNEVLSGNFDEIRYSYRLITLSYLLEAQWHLRLLSDHFKFKDACGFDLSKWSKTCAPKGRDMKVFVDRMMKYSPRYAETLPVTYHKEDWWKEFKEGKWQSYSHYRLSQECKGKCSIGDMPSKLRSACEQNEKLMDLICSESDELFGLSNHREAYNLLGQSNIINTYNKKGEAAGCLRRFSEVMSSKEVKYPQISDLFPVLQTFLRKKYNERFLQGRVFFFGSGKEFEEKGLTNFYVEDRPLKVEKLPEDDPAPVEVVAVPKAVPSKELPPPPPEVKPKKSPKVAEMPIAIPKSAFLQAAEGRAAQNLERVEVDMLKLKYDYVFTLNMMNNLSQKLKTFMTRDALSEMMVYDKLGTKQGPIPLLFLKYMIDMQEHQGLWNLISILGDKFYVSNEIDASYGPGPEFVQLLNNDLTGRQWQIHILRP